MRIYLIRNKQNGKAYVGKTRGSVEDRWRAHQKDPRCFLIHRAIRKHGVKAFSVRVLATAKTERQLSELEKRFIRELKTLAPHGYNLTEGGDGGVQSEVVRRKMSLKAKTRARRPEERRNRSERAKKQGIAHMMTPGALSKKRRPKSRAHRAKLARLNRDKARSVKFRRKLSRALLHHAVSAGTRAKISAAKQGRAAWNRGIRTGPLPLSVRAKMSASHLGKPRPRSPEHQARLTAALRSPVVRAKISAERKAYWAKRKGAAGNQAGAGDGGPQVQ